MLPKCVTQLRFVLLFWSLVWVNLNSVFSNLICRSCGHTITTAAALRNVKSPTALQHYNMSILGKDTLVQIFQNPVPETFHVITANGANLKFSGKSYLEDSWFPANVVLIWDGILSRQKMILSVSCLTT